MEATLFDAARVLVPFVTTFCVGIALAPVLTNYLYKHRVWKKKGGKQALDGTTAVEFNKLHEEREQVTPRMGGILIWGSVFVMAVVTSVLAMLSREYFSSIDFVDRSQTWLPLAGLLAGGIVGFFDDLLEVTRRAGGLALRFRLLIVGLLGAFSGWWFYDKLDVSSVGVPLIGPIELGIFFIPFFVFVTLAVYASGVIDGIDGLAGGVFAIIFMACCGPTTCSTARWAASPSPACSSATTRRTAA